MGTTPRSPRHVQVLYPQHSTPRLGRAQRGGRPHWRNRPDAGIVAAGPLPRTGLVMRIALIAPPWLPVPPPGYGGTEVVLDGLARGLVDAGHEGLLIGHPDSKCPVKRLTIVPAEDAQPMGRAVSELEHALGAYAAAANFDV